MLGVEGDVVKRIWHALLIALLAVGVTGSASASPQPARRAFGLSYFFEQRAEVFIGCDLVEDAGGRHPTYFVGRWFDHADDFYTGGGWAIGHGGWDPAVRASAFGVDARLEPETLSANAQGNLGGTQGPIKAGTTLRMVWLSWDATIACTVTVDGEPVEPFALEAHEYGQIRAADIDSGVGLDTGTAGVTLAGRAPFGTAGYLLALGTPRLGEDMWASDDAGNRANNDPILGMYFHEPTNASWTMHAERVARPSGMPLLVWATIPG